MAKKPSKAKLLELIAKSSGIIAPIARACDASRVSVYHWINGDPELSQALKDAREDMLDVIESKYFKNALDGNIRCQEFILQTLGKDRGYSMYTKVDADIKSESEIKLSPLTPEELEILAKMTR